MRKFLRFEIQPIQLSKGITIADVVNENRTLSATEYQRKFFQMINNKNFTGNLNREKYNSSSDDNEKYIQPGVSVRKRS